LVFDITIYTIIFSLYIIIDLIPAILQKKWKVFWVYVILIICSYIIFFLHELDIKVPSPAAPLKKLVLFIIGS
jgi:hypothetical protein